MASVDQQDELYEDPDTPSALRRGQLAWTAELLDFEDGRFPVPVLDQVGIRRLLAGRPRIAIVGASPDPTRPSHGVLLDLAGLGFDVVPVNPIAERVADRTCYPTLRAAVEAIGQIDIVDVFRVPPACPDHAREAVKIGTRCLWLQLGIVSLEAARIAHDAGLEVVMNRCLGVDALRFADA
ncbi:MAG: CoA-binding protein [Chloroflexota bacterium]